MNDKYKYVKLLDRKIFVSRSRTFETKLTTVRNVNVVLYKFQILCDHVIIFTRNNRLILPGAL